MQCYLNELAMELQKFQECVAECVNGPDYKNVKMKFDDKEMVALLLRKYLK